MLVPLKTSQPLSPTASSHRAPLARPQVPSPTSSAIPLPQLAPGQSQPLALLPGATRAFGVSSQKSCHGDTSFETNVKYFKPDS